MENNAKYTCPACNTKTCSVDCVKRHKLRRECSGQVDPTKFVPNKELSANQSLVNRDYNYLLNFERKVLLGKNDIKTSARNIFKRNYAATNPNKRQRPDPETADPRLAQVNRIFQNNPQTTIKRENTLIIQLPSGMSRASQNKSGYDKKAGSHIWTVEWVPIDSSGTPKKSFISYRLREDVPLRNAVPMNVLQNSAPEESFAQEKLHFFLDNCISTSSKKHSVIALDADATLATALAGKVVLEYPKIYITTDNNIWSEFVQDEREAYGLKPLETSSSSDDSSDSDSDSSDSDSDSDSDDSDDSDEAPEELSSKPEVNEKLETQIDVPETISSVPEENMVEETKTEISTSEMPSTEHGTEPNAVHNTEVSTLQAPTEQV